MAGDDLGSRVLLPGRVPQDEVPDYLAAMDVGSLSQSVDRVGSFRYTTKLAEYFAASLPIVTGEVPAAYDLDDGCMWRLPGHAPWFTYVTALADSWRISPADIVQRRQAISQRRTEPFDKAVQQRRMRAFIEDLLADRARSKRRN